MKKTMHIHISGRAFHINEDAYILLNRYLDSLKQHFSKDGASGKEIIDDLENRMAELFEDRISESKEAITLKDAEEIINILGDIQDFEPEDQTSTAYGEEYKSYSRSESKRFFRDPDNNYLGGVASGLGAYFDIDPIWIRLAFILLFFLHGAGLLIYLLLWIVIPKARNTAEKLQMQGRPVNINTIRDSVNEEFDRLKTGWERFEKSSSKNGFVEVIENIFRAIGLIIIAIFKFIIGIIGIIFIIIGSVFLLALIMLFFGHTNLFSAFTGWYGFNFSEITSLFSGFPNYNLLVFSLLLVIGIPVIVMIYEGIKAVFNIKGRHPFLRAFTLTAWILALVLSISLLIVQGSEYAVEASGSDSANLKADGYQTLYVEVSDNSDNRRITNYRVFGKRFMYSQSDETLYKEIELSVTTNNLTNPQIIIEKEARNVGLKNSDRYLSRIMYHWSQQDSIIYIDKYFRTENEYFWMFPNLKLNLAIPEGRKVVFSDEACEMMNYSDQLRYCLEAE